MSSDHAPLEPNDQVPSKAASLALDGLETEAGGRDSLIVRLLHLEEHGFTEQQEKLLALLTDPSNESVSLARLCNRAGMRVGQFIAFMQKARGAKALLDVFERIYKNVPEVVEDSMRAARVREEDCKKCGGKGKYKRHKRAARTARGGKQQRKPEAEREIMCKSCGGKGKILRDPQIENVRLALGLAGLLPEKGAGAPLVSVPVTLTQSQGQVAAPIAAASAASEARSAMFTPQVLERFLGASDRVLFQREIPKAVVPPAPELPAAKELIDAEPVEAEPAEVIAVKQPAVPAPRFQPPPFVKP